MFLLQFFLLVNAVFAALFKPWETASTWLRTVTGPNITTERTYSAGKFTYGNSLSSTVIEFDSTISIITVPPRTLVLTLSSLL